MNHKATAMCKKNILYGYLGLAIVTVKIYRATYLVLERTFIASERRMQRIMLSSKLLQAQYNFY